MSENTTQTAPEGHPTAEEQLEQIENDRDRMEIVEDRLRRGEIDLPWPHSSKAILTAGVTALLAAGGAITVGAMSVGEDGYTLAGMALLLSGAILIIHARWMRQHFELGEQPTYDTAVADGGDSDDR